MQMNPNIPFIEGDDKMRAKKCLQEIQVLLQQYGCELHPRVTQTPMGNEWGYSIVPKPRTVDLGSN